MQIFVVGGCMHQNNVPEGSQSKKVPDVSQVNTVLPENESSAADQKETSEDIYEKALQALQKNEKIIAYGLFSRLGDYKDSREKIISLRSILTFCPVEFDGLLLKRDGTIINNFEMPNALNYKKYETYKNLISLTKHTYGSFVGIKSDGTLILYGEEGGLYDPTPIFKIMKDWKNIIQVVTGEFAEFGLCRDGSVKVAAINDYCDSFYTDVKSWHNIIQLNCDCGILIGLKSDGTVVISQHDKEIAGDNGNNNSSFNLDVSGWKDIIMVSSYVGSILGLKRDGTILSVGHSQIDASPFNYSKLSDIVAIFGDVGIKSDGSLDLAWNDEMKRNIKSTQYTELKDVIYVNSENDTLLQCFKNDGTVVTINIYDGDDEQIVEVKDVMVP